MTRQESGDQIAIPFHKAFVEHLQKNCEQFICNIQKLTEQRLAPKSPRISLQRGPALASISATPSPLSSSEFLGPQPTPTTKEDIGRATWVFLHSLAAQYPERPTRQQQQDVRNLVDILTRMYPCKECATHFKEVVRHNPPRVASHQELEQWMCQIHNVVNRSLGKPTFNCDLVGSRWGGLDCDEDACSFEVGRQRRK